MMKESSKVDKPMDIENIGKNDISMTIIVFISCIPTNIKATTGTRIALKPTNNG